MYKVSVIITVENGEQYLEETLKTLETQSMIFDNLEIILIDQGSTDRTEEIFKKYSKNKNNCKYHKMEGTESNSKAGSKNIGISYVTGDYMMFLDEKNSYNETAIEDMYNKIVGTDNKFITTNYEVEKKDKEQNTSKEPKYEVEEETVEITMDNLLKKESYIDEELDNKIFKTEFVKENKIEFVEEVENENLIFTLAVLAKSEKAECVKDIVSVNIPEKKTANKDGDIDYFKQVNKNAHELHDSLGFLKNDEYSKTIIVEQREELLDKLLTSQKIDEKDVEQIVFLMYWYFELLSDVRVGNETPIQDKLMECIINKDYEKVIHMRNELTKKPEASHKVTTVITVEKDTGVLEKTLKSIEDQTIGFENIEVVVLDTGQNEETERIYKEFAKKRKNCKYYKQEEKTDTTGELKNKAIENAMGKYLVFATVYDIYGKDSLNKMYNTMEENDYEFLSARYERAKAEGVFDITKFKTEDLVNNIDIYDVVMGNKMFDTEVLREKNIKFEENIYVEDAAFMIEVSDKSKGSHVPYITNKNVKPEYEIEKKELTNDYKEKTKDGFKAVSKKLEDAGQKDKVSDVVSKAKGKLTEKFMNKGNNFLSKNFVD